LGYEPVNTDTSRGIQFVPQTVLYKVRDFDGNTVYVELLISTVSFGADHTACIGVDTNVYSWGTNTSGKLGNGNRSSHVFPFIACTSQILQAVPIIISCGGYHTLVVTDKKTLWTAGSGRFGTGHEQYPLCSLLFRQVYVKGEDNKKKTSSALTPGRHIQS